jgi:methionine-S-sulfoxide reductase
VSFGRYGRETPYVYKKHMTKKAYLALGCFWGPEEHFGNLPGILKTRVGYSGGTEDHASYENIGGHAETLELEFDPKKISFTEILEQFFMEHDPKFPEVPRYRSIIFYLDANQRKAAEETKEATSKKLRYPLYTEIKKFEKFFPAEKYHQKYFDKLKNKE